MGIQPDAFRHMTPLEFHETQETFLESWGQVSARRRVAALRDLDRLKQLHPDTPTAGSA